MRDQLDPDHWCNGGEYSSSHPDALAMEALDAENKQLRAEVERLREAQRWIPVKERLPHAERPVFTLCNGKTRSIQYRFPDGGWTTSATVTHWMPLPEPPETLP